MNTIKNILFLILIFSISLSGRDKNIERYIKDYQYIAVSEMERTGIPASIKLAQGILESNAGRSTLAQKANNHFGIKCGGRWKGKKYYKKDDDYKNGKLIKSCFRKYKNSETSYLAHSDFLLDNQRYRFLFSLNPSAYKKWAKGLKKAGYATSKTYDKKLIRIIEEYKLYKYDRTASSDMVAKAKSKTRLSSEIIYINDAKMTYAKVGETPAAIAQRTKTSVNRILKYNELLRTANQPLTIDDKIFLQEKRKNYRGKQKYHTVLAGETMYNIAQTYGLRLDKLYKKNKMPRGTEPAVGETIRIRGKNRRKPRLRKTKTNTPPAPVLIDKKEKETTTSKDKDFKPAVRPKDTENRPTNPEITIPPKEEATPPQIETRRYHTVVKGETLWRISQMYNTSVEEIQRLNNLTGKIIKVGARLRVE